MWIARKGEILFDDGSTLGIKRGIQRFEERRGFIACCPNHRFGPEEMPIHEDPFMVDVCDLCIEYNVNTHLL